MLGKLIAIEGDDGSGKSTVSLILKERLELFVSREPGGTEFGEKLRKILIQSYCGTYEEICLFFASRRKHLEEIVFPRMIDGETVVLDRYAASSFAYQVYGRNRLDLAELLKYLLRFCEIPSDVRLGEGLKVHYIWLDVDPVVGKERRQKTRGWEDHFEKEDLDFHDRVREGFEQFLGKGLCYDFHIVRPEVYRVDANQELDLVVQDVEKIVRTIIAK